MINGVFAVRVDFHLIGPYYSIPVFSIGVGQAGINGPILRPCYLGRLLSSTKLPGTVLPIFLETDGENS